MIKFAYYTSGIAVFAFTPAYLALVAYLFDYLKRVHRPTWVELGNPSFETMRAGNPSETTQMAQMTLRFMLLGDQHKMLEDGRLNKLILSIRVVFVIVAISWVALITFGIVTNSG